jgi:hypothetical protein
MTTLNIARKLIYDTFDAGWAGEIAPVYKDNEKGGPTSSSSWIRLSVVGRTSSQETMGKSQNRKFLRKGTIFTQVFIPTQIGMFEGDRLCSKIRNIFEGKRLSSEIWVDDVDIREVGPEGDFYLFLVESFFNYEEIK